jgi:hypothetical protein
MSSSSLRKPVWTFLYLDIVSFSLEEKLFLAILTRSKKTEFLSHRAFFGIFSGGCLTLNVDHFSDRRSPIGARVCGMDVQLSDTTISGGDTGEDPVGRSEYPDRPKPM